MKLADRSCDLCGETARTRWKYYVTPDPDLPRSEGHWLHVCRECRSIVD